MPPVKNFGPQQVVTAGDMSASVTSSVVDTRYLDTVGFQFVWSAGSTPVGTLDIQCSFDWDGVSTGTWTSLTLSSTPSVSGNTGSTVVNLAAISFPYMRAVYTRTSGSGTLNAYVAGRVD